jgi:hypothetical protein
MSTSFDILRGFYDNDQFADLLRDPDGIYWLKLRTISRAEQLRQFCKVIGLHFEGIQSRQLLPHVYNHRPSNVSLESFVRQLYQAERSVRKANEDYLISQLYQMKVFDWGGLYQNSLEQTIINNYVKRIQSWDDLNLAIENQIHTSLRGYVQCSWYNHWSSILIEDIFKDHPAVLPAMGLVKKVDFFIHNFPFDLKVTYFPEGYMSLLRRNEGLRPEFTELKAFCRQLEIRFNNYTPQDTLFTELLTRISEHPSDAARNFITDFRAVRARLIQQTIQNPTHLIIWLYENQGVRRFDASNRLFLILVDINHLEDSWKLKRNKVLLTDGISEHLDRMRPDAMSDLQLEFHWQNYTYETYASILFIVVQ